MEEHNITLAGVPVQIRSRFSKTWDFLADYETESEALFTVEPTAEDLARIEASLDLKDEAEGIPKRRQSGWYVELTAIHTLLAENLVNYDVLLMHGSALCMDGSLYPCEHCPPESRFGDIWHGTTDEAARKAFCRVDQTREKCRACPHMH